MVRSRCVSQSWQRKHEGIELGALRETFFTLERDLMVSPPAVKTLHTVEFAHDRKAQQPHVQDTKSLNPCWAAELTNPEIALRWTPFLNKDNHSHGWVWVPYSTLKSIMTSTGKLLILIDMLRNTCWNGNTHIFEQTWVNAALKVRHTNESYHWVPSPKKELFYNGLLNKICSGTHMNIQPVLL